MAPKSGISETVHAAGKKKRTQQRGEKESAERWSGKKRGEGGGRERERERQKP